MVVSVERPPVGRSPVMRDNGCYGGNKTRYNPAPDGPSRGHSMQDGTNSTAVDQARQASHQGKWQEAYEQLLDADAQSPLSAEDLPFLATVAYASGHLDAAIDAWE